MQTKSFFFFALVCISISVFGQNPCLPTVIVKNGIAANLVPTNIDADPEADALRVTVKATDFVLYGQNNCGAPGPLQFSIRKSGEGIGWPGSAFVQYECNDAGVQLVEIWVKDGSGKVNFSESYVIIQDTHNDCSNFSPLSMGCAGDVIPPTLKLINGFAIGLGDDHSITIHATALVQSKTDNCPGKITLRISKAGLFSEPPATTSVTFTCDDLGTQSVDVWAIDKQGNWTRAETYVLVQTNYGSSECFFDAPLPTTCGNDQVAPQIIARNGLSVGIQPTGAGTAGVTLYAKDFVFNVSDNCSNGPFPLKIRKADTGTGAPVEESVTFDCSELGTQTVEVWSVDAAGNWDFSQTYVIIQDNLTLCFSPRPANAADRALPAHLKNEMLARYPLGQPNLDRSDNPLPESPILVSVTPNPVTDHFTLTLQAQQAGHTALYLYDGLGRLLRVLEADATLLEGDNVFTYEVQDLPSGSYRVVAAGANGVTTVHVVK